MADEVFVDGILGAGFSQGALRIDFFTFSDLAKAGKEARLRLVMTPEGFAQAYAQLTQVMEQLKKTRGATGVPEAAPEPRVPSDKITPNF